MSNPVDKIKKLIDFLPESDQALAHQFITMRDFESLKDLVHSDIYKLERKQLESITTPTEFLSPKTQNLTMLESLYFEIDMYISLIYGVSNWESDGNDDDTFLPLDNLEVPIDEEISEDYLL